MKTLQEKKDCINALLSRNQSEFTEHIEKLESISNVDDYDIFFTVLCKELAIYHNSLLTEIHLCQNENRPTEIQKINIL